MTLSPETPPQSSGTIELRVRYCECDSMAVAHHGSYAAWLEMGRTELLRTSGVSYKALEAAGVFLVIAKMEIRYRRPIRYDDVLEIRTIVASGTRIKITHDYEIRLLERDGADLARLRDRADDLLAVASTTLACVNRDGVPTPLPDWLMAENRQ